MRSSKKLDGYMGQKYQIVAFHKGTLGEVIMGWTDNKDGGSAFFQAKMKPQLENVKLINLEAYPRKLANGFIIYRSTSKRGKRTFEVLDYGVLEFKDLKIPVVICAEIPPVLTIANLDSAIQESRDNPKMVVFQRKDFFSKFEGVA